MQQPSRLCSPVFYSMCYIRALYILQVAVFCSCLQTAGGEIPKCKFYSVWADGRCQLAEACMPQVEPRALTFQRARARQRTSSNLSLIEEREEKKEAQAEELAADEGEATLAEASEAALANLTWWPAQSSHSKPRSDEGGLFVPFVKSRDRFSECKWPSSSCDENSICDFTGDGAGVTVKQDTKKVVIRDCSEFYSNIAIGSCHVACPDGYVANEWWASAPPLPPNLRRRAYGLQVVNPLLRSQLGYVVLWAAQHKTKIGVLVGKVLEDSLEHWVLLQGQGPWVVWDRCPELW